MSKAEDSLGVTLKEGDFVKTLSSRLVLQALPDSASEEEAEKVANENAVVHEIRSPGIVDIELIQMGIMTRLKSLAVKWQKRGFVALLRDDSEVTIGCFVKTLEDVQDLQGVMSDSWLHGMEETCGRTGRVVRILDNSDVLVQFAWGLRYYFKPEALRLSSADHVVTQDSESKWMGPGTTVKIHKDAPAMEISQKSLSLPSDARYKNLSRKYGQVKNVRLKPFLSPKVIQITFKDQIYHLNADSLHAVDSVLDRHGNEVRVGDKVELPREENALRRAQTLEFGGWKESLKSLLGQSGRVVGIEPDKLESTKVGLLVQFKEQTWFLNPSAISNVETSQEEESVGFIRLQEQELQQIAREEIELFEHLGEGGFGTVYRGHWKRGKGQIVAVKEVSEHVASKIPFEQMMQEAKTQFTMRHPNVVALHGYSLRKDLWLIMDFVNGKDLHTILHQPSSGLPLPRERELKLALDMSSAMAYVHQKGFVHCDIKPHNMMVDQTNGKLYICDFGISRQLGVQDLQKMQATQYTTKLTGTLYYVAPECLQVDEDGRYQAPGFHSDVWALGVVFFELFTRAFIYDVELAFIFMLDKSTGNDGKVKDRLSKVPSHARNLVTKTLEFDKGKRPTAQKLSEYFYELLCQGTAAM